MTKMNLLDALQKSLEKTKIYIDSGLAEKADSSHKHNYAGSSSAGGAATSANKVNTNLIIKLNGGSTEGTNLFTFNGSSAKTINITPSSIGAAASSHGTHLTLGTGSGNAYRGDYGNTAYTHSQAAHAPSNAQKNSDITKAEIEAKLTGTITSHNHSGTYAAASHGTHVTYGTITPLVAGTASIGSASTVSRSDHVHPAQTTVSGNAGSATKLANARNIVIGNKTNSFNGSANITYTLNDIGAAPGSTSTATTAATAQWYRIAQTAVGINRNLGIFTIESTVSGKHSITQLNVGINYGLNPTIQQLAHSDYSTAGITKARIVYHTSWSGNYAYLEVYQAAATAATMNVVLSNNIGWTLVTPNTVGSIPSGYTSKEITLVNNKIVANIQGSVSGSSGSCTGNAATATKATQDSAGQQINTTYIKGLSVSGKTITYTRGNGTTGTITTQDTNTTYTADTGIKLNGTKFQHTNAVTAGTAQGDATKTLSWGGTFTIPTVTYDAQGHITAKGTTTMTMPSNPNTDTHHQAKNIVGASTTATANATSSNGSTYLNLIENGAVRSTHKISGTGATTVTSDSSGNITINSTNTTYSAATTSANGLMTSAMVTKLNGIATNANNYSHPIGDGNLHVPATGTTNSGKVLMAGSTAGSLSWTKIAPSHIALNSSNRFITDAERTAWNAKSNLALGTSSSTAFRGDQGLTAYNHSQAAHAPSNAQKNSDITKAEIEAKLTGNITSHTHTSLAQLTVTGNVSANSFTENGIALSNKYAKMVTLSQAEYDALTSYDNNTLYVII